MEHQKEKLMMKKIGEIKQPKNKSLNQKRQQKSRHISRKNTLFITFWVCLSSLISQALTQNHTETHAYKLQDFEPKYYEILRKKEGIYPLDVALDFDQTQENQWPVAYGDLDGDGT